ncbi:MAG: DEAD/DEAH box helicase [Patescibacteria group bacterium]
MTEVQVSGGDSSTFHGLGIAPGLLSILDTKGFKSPTPIQKQAIPPGIEGKDVIGVAQTGTGKTLAFGIPMVQLITRLSIENPSHQGFGLILLPTRELALQVEETIRTIGGPLRIKTAIIIGGASMRPQITALRARPHVVIATPGRLLDHMEQKNISLAGVKAVVFDEADRMLDMGFWPQIRSIVQALPADRQTMLFSATLSNEITDLARKHMKMPVSIEVSPPGTTAERVTQEFFFVQKNDKSRLLESILSKFNGSTLVFTRTKHGAKRLTRAVHAMGHTAAEIHGNRSLNQRKDALEGFKKGKYRVLVATDIAARGIDVKGIELVVNYDMPMQTADYVHRIGRTARAGAEGHAITFAESSERGEVRNIERLTRVAVKVSALPTDMPPSRAMPVVARDERQRHFSSRPSHGRSSHAPAYRSHGSFGGGSSHASFGSRSAPRSPHSSSGSSHARPSSSSFSRSPHARPAHARSPHARRSNFRRPHSSGGPSAS